MERKNAFNGSGYAMPLVSWIGLVLSGNGCAHKRIRVGKIGASRGARPLRRHCGARDRRPSIQCGCRISEEDSASQWTRDEEERHCTRDARESADGGETESGGDGGRALSEDPVVCQPGMVYVPPGVFLYGPFRLRSIPTLLHRCGGGDGCGVECLCRCRGV